MLAIFLDIETTGLDPKKHFTIDIAFQIIDLLSNTVIHSYQSLVTQTQEEWAQHDPKSLEINGYSWEQVQQGKDRETVGKEIITIFKKYDIVRGKSVFICQNPAFDRVFMTQLVGIPTQEELQWPYHWLDLASMYWALLVEKCNVQNEPFPLNITLSQNKIAERYNLPPETSPHRAINGVEHLMQCYECVLKTKFSSSVKESD